ncbi:mannose-6-phosphate isomerase [Streptococcus pneumoniae]|nr:mannose-6-phosphate isomerase [Streptococcus pneumoniae]
MSEPLFLQSVMQEKIWGGAKLRDEFGYDIPSEKIGEYWAISAHPNGVSKVANGRYEGTDLATLYAEHRELFGNRPEPVFPLLTKILDANDWLSVQVHPDDAYGLEHEGELGKTECWYIIAADEGSEIIYGHNAKSKEELRQQIEDKNWDALLTKVPVKAGDFFYVPSGTMHAIGAGILILETQQSSDTTYRVYDFDRELFFCYNEGRKIRQEIDMSEPLFLQSVMQEKIWGGAKLRDEFGYDIPSEKVGEYWAISAHLNGVSKVANGRYEGTDLATLYAEHRELFGNRPEPVFPLLTKILDANDWLSVQVHPDDAYGLEHEGELGKTECWYIIAADEGSEIIYGHNAKSKEELRQQIEDKNWDALLTKVPVKAGDFFYVPSGTMHAIGAGILILETQQSSDTTYRVYDFDRKDDKGNLRELHLEKSIDVLNIGEPANSRPVTVKADDLRSTLLVSNDFFAVYKWEITGKVDFEKTADYSLLSVLAGQGQLTVDGKNYPIQKGSHFILPSDVEAWTLEGQGLELIVSHP